MSGVFFALTEADTNDEMMELEEIRDNLVDAIYACPNGVERFIPTIPDTVETSSNLPMKKPVCMVHSA